MKTGSLNLLEPSGPVQVCTGTAVPFNLYFSGDSIGPRPQGCSRQIKCYYTIIRCIECLHKHTDPVRCGVRLAPETLIYSTTTTTVSLRRVSVCVCVCVSLIEHPNNCSNHTLTTSPLKTCTSCTVQLKCDGTRWRTGGEVKGKLENGVGSQYSSHYLGTWCIQHYSSWCAHLGCQMSTELTPPTDLNGLVRFAERRNLVSARVPSHFKRSLPLVLDWHQQWNCYRMKNLANISLSQAVGVKIGVLFCLKMAHLCWRWRTCTEGGALVLKMAHLCWRWRTWTESGALGPKVAHLDWRWRTCAEGGALVLKVAHLDWRWRTCAEGGALVLKVAHLYWNMSEMLR